MNEPGPLALVNRMLDAIEAISLERLDLSYPEGHAERERVTPRLKAWNDHHQMTPSQFLAAWERSIASEAAERERVRREVEAQERAALEAGGKDTARS